MRLPNNQLTIATGFAALAAIAVLAGCAASGAGAGPRLSPSSAVNGPAADYPVTIGLPYTVDGVTYTPTDVWNYDEVGYASLENAGGPTISGSSHTLPLPSYVEVTSLETGKTILVRIERRGPLESHDVVALSPGAAEQLGISRATPVRVRRVNPQEPERAALRAGNRAPDRMDTPMSLVNVLRLKLPGSGPETSIALPQSVAGGEQPEAPSAPPSLPSPALEPELATAAPAPVSPPRKPASPPPPAKQAAPVPVAQAPVTAARVQPAEKPAATAAKKGFFVQAGAFSSKARAEKVAGAIGGEISKAGSLYRVRTGPFGSRNAAEASLAKVKAAGYSDARIYSDG
ncbi:SPOR domain-containing protein [Altererythrobacter sp. CC-YST694]|uniref:SPOR domain-containing protein n=1 Tax=Altererythrobacter sp. CC-YST694 TaxID=2755038 RepID=UPI001D00344A|nr:SPOR domain-containing protein [Altererythrobacter sp. CC-YST694]MCB5424514.1 SPOR domain-containing protein [Altererythrobacter sp. CC-YST694]